MDGQTVAQNPDKIFWEKVENLRGMNTFSLHYKDIHNCGRVAQSLMQPPNSWSFKILIHEMHPTLAWQKQMSYHIQLENLFLFYYGE